MKKRLLSGIAALVMSVFAVPMTAYAAGDEVTVKVDSVSASTDATDPVAVKVTIPSNTGFRTLDFKINWDKDALELVNISPDPSDSEADLNVYDNGSKPIWKYTLDDDEEPVFDNPKVPANRGSNGFALGSAGKKSELKNAPGFNSDANAFTYTGTVFTLYFKVKSTAAAGDYAIEITDSMATDKSAITAMTCNTVNGKVSVSKPHEHSVKTAHSAVNPTCTEKGKRAYYECECGKFFDTADCSHEVDQAWIDDGDAALGHDWVKGTTVAPTCQEKGYTNYSCSRCTATKKDDETNKVAHNFSVKGETVAPKCGDDGYTVYKCEWCDETENRDIVAATGEHSWDTATYTWTGHTKCVASHTCSVCSKTETETAEGTNIVETITKPATCTEDGVKTYTAKFTNFAENVCDSKGKIDKLGHNWDDGTETTKPTCTEKGVKTFKCTNSGCTETYTEDIDPLGHDWDEGTVTTPPTCEGKGVKTFHCQRPGCEETKTEDVNPTGHEWNEWKTTLEPTEDTDGSAERTCKHNPEHKETKVIPALGHEHAMEHHPAKAATCMEAGNKEYYVCTKCGNWYEDEAGTKEITDHDSVIIPKTDTHTWGEWKVVTEATEDAEGQEKRECTIDGCTASETRNIPKIVVAYTADNVEWTKGSGNDATIVVKRSTADEKTFGEYQSFTVDGDTIPAENFKTEEGSLKLTLLNAYLETLAVGNHTVAITMAKGTVNATLTVKAAADNGNTDSGNTDTGNTNTGDTPSQTGAAAGTAGAVALLVAAAAVAAKKRK